MPRRGTPDAIVVVRDADGKLRDLSWVPGADEEVVPVAANTDEGRSVIRHSTAHVLAQAVQNLFPQAKLGIGPPIADGFYYDFDVAEPFTPEDLAALEKRMRQIVKEGQLFDRRVYESKDQAREELTGEPYKLELVDDKSGDPDVMEVGGDELTAYDNLNPRTRERVWGDLCRGPHIPTSKHIPAFKLTRSSAAYWRGDQNNASLQRIYGTAWESQEALDQHLELIAEAQRRDHRKLGVELDLFSFPDEIGSGLAVFHPKGGIVRAELEDYSRRKHVEAGYEFVNTPHITKEQLYITSGHLEWYAEGMYPPMHIDAEFNEDGTVRKPGQDYYLKPMNCPMHHLIYRARGRSYRELPLRLFEFGSVYRYEKSGVVHGLTRVRGMTQDDAHIYCTREQMRDELASLLRFVLDLLADYGLDDYYLETSTKDPDKYVGSDEVWDEATEVLREVGTASGLQLLPDPGGAAFYGPKISVQVKDALGRNWQMSTIQLDFNMRTVRRPGRQGAWPGRQGQPVGTNSLLDINVFGRRAGISAANYARGHDFVDLPPDPAAMVVGWVADILSERGDERVADIRGALQQSMDNNAAVFRTEETLKQALTDIHALKERYSRITVQDKESASTATCWKPSSWASC